MNQLHIVNLGKYFLAGVFGAMIAVAIQSCFELSNNKELLTIPGSIVYDLNEGMLRVKRQQDKPGSLFVSDGSIDVTIEFSGWTIKSRPVYSVSINTMFFVLEKTDSGQESIFQVVFTNNSVTNYVVKELLSVEEVVKATGSRKTVIDDILTISDDGLLMLLNIGIVERPSVISSEQMVYRPFVFNARNSTVEPFAF
jgi:hypothetical protein